MFKQFQWLILYCSVPCICIIWNLFIDLNLQTLPCNMLKMVYNPSVRYTQSTCFSNKKWFHNNYFNIWIAFNCYFGAHQSPFDSWTGIQQDRRGSTPSPPLTTEVPWASCWCMTSPIQKPLKTSPSGYGILMRWGQILLFKLVDQNKDSYFVRFLWSLTFFAYNYVFIFISRLKCRKKPWFKVLFILIHIVYEASTCKQKERWQTTAW